MDTQADIKLIDHLLEKKVVDCVRCNNLLQPPVMLVDGMGNMCHSCYGALENNDNVTALENVALNVILDHIEIPCTYKTQGCEERLKYNDFKTHIDQCAYATFCCDFSPTCQWTGCFTQLASHCRDHKDIILSNAADCYKFPVEKDFKQITYILGTSCGLFFLKMKMLKDVLKILIFDFTHHDPVEYHFDIIFEANSGSKYVETCKAIKNFKSFITFDSSLESSIDMNLIKNIIFCNGPDVEMNIKLNDYFKSEINNLWPLVKCSKCLSHIRTEIYVCANGHNTCNSCIRLRSKSPSDTCSRCSNHVVRCLPLETLAKYVRPPCRFKDSGCQVKMLTRSHEMTCIFRTWSCFTNDCNDQFSYPELILHAKNHHKIPNGFMNLSGLRINRKVAEEQVYHVLEHNLIFELIYNNTPMEKYGGLTDEFTWRVNIISEYDKHPYRFEVEICFGEANPIHGIILKGSCVNKNLIKDHTGLSDFRERYVKLSGTTLKQIYSSQDGTFDYKVRVFKER